VYLSDNEIRAALSELNVQTGNTDHPFDPDKQIQPASIDLRLSEVVWKQRLRPRFPPVDLGPSRFRTVRPRSHWQRRALRATDAITLKPGEMVLARVYESLTIPTDCAGHLTGRSSFARMGLQVHATGDFINPGWNGHMPLTLTNVSRTMLRIPPYTAVCQLALVRLSSLPDRAYGHAKLNSKYVDDDGGPSYWWRDQALTSVQAQLASRGYQDQAVVLDRIGPPSDEVLGALERFLHKTNTQRAADGDALVASFVKSEDRRRRWNQVLRRGPTGLLVALVGTTLATLDKALLNPFHYSLWGATIVVAGMTLRTVTAPARQYFGQRELDRHDAAGS
jgi:deoxycytidine triphosphate deaminase